MFMKLRKMMTNQKGFTLVELMVVIAIIGVLAAVAIPKFSSVTNSALDAKLKSDLSSMDGAIMQYYVATGGYPTTANASADLVTTYISVWPTDSQKKNLVYTYTAATTTAAASYNLAGNDSTNTTRYSPASSSYTAW